MPRFKHEYGYEEMLEFKYTNICAYAKRNKIPRLLSSEYGLIFNSNFIQVALNGTAEKPSLGWKFHISLDARGAEKPDSNIAKGWDIACKILMEHNIQSFKVVNADASAQMIHEQAHKHITIYACESSNETMEEILDEIMMQFIDQGIKPNAANRDEDIDRVVDDSRYFGYRNDSGHNGAEYVSADSLAWHLYRAVKEPKQNDNFFDIIGLPAHSDYKTGESFVAYKNDLYRVEKTHDYYAYNYTLKLLNHPQSADTNWLINMLEKKQLFFNKNKREGIILNQKDKQIIKSNSNYFFSDSYNPSNNPDPYKNIELSEKLYRALYSLSRATDSDPREELENTVKVEIDRLDGECIERVRNHILGSDNEKLKNIANIYLPQQIKTPDKVTYSYLSW